MTIKDLLQKMIQEKEKQLAVLREAFDMANDHNDTFNQGQIAQAITKRVAELDALLEFAKRWENES